MVDLTGMRDCRQSWWWKGLQGRVSFRQRAGGGGECLQGMNIQYSIGTVEVVEGGGDNIGVL